jgi:MFS family permease
LLTDGLLIGFVIDLLGTQRSLVLGACLLICGRLLLAIAEDTTTLWLALFFTVPLGEALAIPVLTVMLKRYSLPENRAAAFGLFYVTMNLGAVLSGWMVQLLSDVLPAEGVELLPGTGRVWSVYQMVVLSGWVAQLLVLPLAFSMRQNPPELRLARRQQVGDRSSDSDPEERHGHGGSDPLVAASPEGGIYETLRTKRFWRFLLLTCTLITIKHSLWSESLTPKWST